MASPKTIKIKVVNTIQEEAAANAAITPGNLVERLSTGKVRKHATAGGRMTPVLVAIEDENQGNGIDVAYAADNRVQMVLLRSGDKFYGLLKEGQNATLNCKLESAGNGELQVSTDDSAAGAANTTQFTAREALDLSDSSGADPASRRIIAEVE